MTKSANKLIAVFLTVIMVFGMELTAFPTALFMMSIIFISCLSMKAECPKAFYNDIEITSLNDSGAADFRLNHVGFVFQFFDLLPELTTAENILLPARLVKKSVENCQKLVLGAHVRSRVRLVDIVFDMTLSQNVKADIAGYYGGEIARLRTVRVGYPVKIIGKLHKRVLNGVLRVLLVFQNIDRYPEHQTLVILV